MSTELVQRKANDLKGLLERAKDQIQAALPKHLTPERMARIALTEARKNPKLLECDATSFLGAVIQASQLGLEPGGARGHCYLIPFKNNKRGIFEVQFMIGYQGMLDLVRRSGNITHVVARSVYDCDDFSFQYGLSEKLDHTPKPRNEKSKLVYFYAIGFLKDSPRAIFDVMSISEVLEIMQGSKSKDDGPWKTDFEAMGKKTVIRRLFKYLPASVEMQTAMRLDELVDANVTQNNSSVIDVPSSVADEPPKAGASALNSLVDSKAAPKSDFETFGQTQGEPDVAV
jgi:recombination protein RecT